MQDCGGSPIPPLTRHLEVPVEPHPGCKPLPRAEAPGSAQAEHRTIRQAALAQLTAQLADLPAQ